MRKITHQWQNDNLGNKLDMPQGKDLTSLVHQHHIPADAQSHHASVATALLCSAQCALLLGIIVKPQRLSSTLHNP